MGPTQRVEQRARWRTQWWSKVLSVVKLLSMVVTRHGFVKVIGVKVGCTTTVPEYLQITLNHCLSPLSIFLL